MLVYTDQGKIPSKKEFEALLIVFNKAYERAAFGKGAKRHGGDNKKFEEQLICEIPRNLDIGFNLGQALKKAYEQSRMDTDNAINELLDAIVYIAGAVIVLNERKKKE